MTDLKARAKGLVFMVLSLLNYAGVDFTVPVNTHLTETVSLTELNVPTAAEAYEMARVDAIGGGRVHLQ